jgi:ubiquinone/menaquinone biosynthesis C-methylase UbiE
MKNRTNGDKKVKIIWSSYWKDYHGVTKIGAWSQKQALMKALDIASTEHLKKESKIIDIGCGEGRTLKAFRIKGYKKSIGLDFTKESLVICQKNGFTLNKDVFWGDASKLNFKNREFDLVFSEGLLEHFTDPTKIIKEMCRVSKKYVLLIQPNHYSIYGRLISVLGHFLRNNVKEYSFTKEYFIQKFLDEKLYLQKSNSTKFGEFFNLLFKRK